MNTLLLADLVLDYAAAAGVSLFNIMSATVWDRYWELEKDTEYVRIGLDLDTNVHLLNVGETEWAVSLHNSPNPIVWYADARAAARGAIVVLLQERTRYAFVDGAPDPVIFKAIAEAAWMRVTLKSTPDGGYATDGVRLVPSLTYPSKARAYRRWDIIAREEVVGWQPGHEVMIAGSQPLRTALVAAIEYTAKYRMEEFDR